MVQKRWQRTVASAVKPGRAFLALPGFLFCAPLHLYRPGICCNPGMQWRSLTRHGMKKLEGPGRGRSAAIAALRWLGAGLAGVLAVWALAWFAVPPLARLGIERWALDTWGRSATVGKVEFRPWTMELFLHDVSLAGASPGAPPQVEIRRIYIDMELQSLVRLGPVLDAVEVDAPRWRLVRGKDGRFDVDDLLRRWAAASGQAGARQGRSGARFAFYNLRLRDGSIDFTDRGTGQSHALRGLDVGLPFLSNLTVDRQATVTPQLAFTLDGSRFESHAEATPFAEDRQARARLKVEGLDLSPLRAYWPEGVPMRPLAGKLDADLALGFGQGEVPRLAISGRARVLEARLEGPAGADPLSFESLDVHAASIEPLQRRAHLASVHWTSPRIALHRDAGGQLDWAGAARREHGGAAGSEETTAPPWRVVVDRAAVQGGRVAWRDDSTGRPVAMALEAVSIQASSLAWPWKGGLPFAAHARLAFPATPSDARKAVPATLGIEGMAWPDRGQVAASLRGLPLAAFDGYLAASFAPQLRGAADADAGIAWNRATGAVVARLARLSVDRMVLSCGDGGRCGVPSAIAVNGAPGTPSGDAVKEGPGYAPGVWAQADRLEVEDAVVHLTARTASVGRFLARAPKLRVEREASGRWMFEGWAVRAPGVPAPATGTAEVSRTAAAPAPAAAPWSVRVDDAAVADGVVALRDAVPSATAPVQLQWSSIALRARGLAWPVGPSAAGAAGAAPVQLSLSADWEAGRRAPGRLSYEGRLSMAPVGVQGRLQAQRLPLHVLEPYVAPWLNVHVARAEAGFDGEVRYASGASGAVASARGNAALDEVRVRAIPPAAEGPPAAAAARGEDLLRWRNLALQGVDWRVEPGSPVRLDVRETALREFFARIVLQKNGRLNLQDLVRDAAESSGTGQPAAAAQAAGRARAAGTPPAATASATAPAGDAAGTDTPAVAGGDGAGPATGSKAVLRFGPVVLSAGSVRFTDYFIEPNYSADLGELAGRLGAFSSEPPPDAAAPDMAELELAGRVQGSASLLVSGRLNPLAKPLALDIQGRVRDLDLPPLSPYAVKYVGHGIERGKLGMEVRYTVLPDGQLTAGNRLVLQQLVFGEPVEGAPASLPVRLAAALLADRNGVIDLDLPISGSLNDPQFSLAPVILRAVGSLVLKAVTSPFTLLANAFGGGSAEQGAVAFAPGSAELDAAALEGLEKVARSLRDRPALRLTVTGHASADGEEEGWKRERLRAQVQQLVQRRAAGRAAGGTAAQAAADPARDAVPGAGAAAAAQADGLRELYRRADFPKPRNLLGLARDIPPAEMEALLLAQIRMPAGALQELAQARAVAVRDRLARDGIPLERLFVAAPRVDDAAPARAAPRAELSLEAR